MLSGLFSFQGRYRILHLTWVAFFLTFICWFNFAPLATTIGKEFGLTPEQIKTLGICNLALTIPARIVIGMLLDRFGPRIIYSSLLIFSTVPCLVTAISQNFHQLVISRLLMGIVGAGFVVGIRMVAEWFPPQEIGIAQGIYGGWGNFGAFGAEFTLPIIALAGGFWIEGGSNWRGAIALTGIIAAIYGAIYYCNVQDTPIGKVYQKPKRNGAIEVTSPKSFWAAAIMNFGLIFALGLLVWRLAQPSLNFLGHTQMLFAWMFLGCLFIFQTYRAWQVNREVLSGIKIYAANERYQFRQVALLAFAYATSFGSELTVASMLPAFFEQTFSFEHLAAGAIASTYPFMNLIARPSGGLLCDRAGSRKWTLTLLATGIGICYLLAYRIDRNWSIPLAIGVIAIAACFSQASSGANSGIVPLIKKEITGQISGHVGAYGNFGSVVYLTIFSLTDARTLFQVMGIAALICASLCAFFLKEPTEDGTKTLKLVTQSNPFLISRRDAEAQRRK
jgi:NNP family nitrate/nitrite transporter-like MFS transporter